MVWKASTPAWWHRARAAAWRHRARAAHRARVAAWADWPVLCRSRAWRDLGCPRYRRRLVGELGVENFEDARVAGSKPPARDLEAQPRGILGVGSCPERQGV